MLVRTPPSHWIKALGLSLDVLALPLFNLKPIRESIKPRESRCSLCEMCGKKPQSGQRIRFRNYRPQEVKVVEDLDAKFISPAFPAPKAHGSWRLVIDFRELNSGRKCLPKAYQTYSLTLLSLRGRKCSIDAFASSPTDDGEGF
eukprot:GHVP01013483.1.p1 GENE.GHVP01013483.1~~GHVP01013483.1.p1  ORF type:complete len:144 (+),score=13.64 GHVP01013483.1:41-472(+)